MHVCSMHVCSMHVCVQCVCVFNACVFNACVLNACVFNACVFNACVFNACVFNACVFNACVFNACVLNACVLNACVFNACVLTPAVSPGVCCACIRLPTGPGGAGRCHTPPPAPRRPNQSRACPARREKTVSSPRLKRPNTTQGWLTHGDNNLQQHLFLFVTLKEKKRWKQWQHQQWQHHLV